MAKQICPLLIPVSEQELEDFNAPTRTKMMQELSEQHQGLKFAQSQLGLVMNLFPRKAAHYDESQLIDFDSEALKKSKEAQEAMAK